MDDVRSDLSPPMQHEPRSERQEHQGQNGYKTLRFEPLPNPSVELRAVCASRAFSFVGRSANMRPYGSPSFTLALSLSLLPAKS